MEFALCYSLQFTVENESAFALVLRVRFSNLSVLKNRNTKENKGI